jgi:hypothetical protein
MSSIFKINTRFSVLVEDVKNDNNPTTSTKGGYEKSSNNNPQVNSFSFKRNDRQRGDDKLINSFNETKRKHELDRKNKEITEALSDKNFPVLGIINRTTLDVTENKALVTSFLDKINVNIKNSVEPCEEYIQPGYIVITRDKITNNVITKYGEQLRFSCEEDNNPNKVLDSLVNLYEIRKDKYIELWGDYEYEKVFKFPNYDYEYFNRLDQEYLEEMERQLNRRREFEDISYVSSDEY